MIKKLVIHSVNRKIHADCKRLKKNIRSYNIKVFQRGGRLCIELQSAMMIQNM